MNYQFAFTHPFQDQNWLKKLAIGALISLVPVLNFALYGYLIRHYENTRQGRDLPLPEWDNIGAMFVDGLKLLVVTLVYSLPLLILTIIYLIAFAATAANNGEDAGAAFLAFTLLFSCVSLIYSLLLTWLLPAVVISYAEQHRIGDALQLSKVLAVTRYNTTAYIVILLLTLGMTFALSIVLSLLAGTVFLLCLAIPLGILASVYLVLFFANLYGQYVRTYAGNTQPQVIASP